jgi:hypothetical protein
MSKKSSKKSSKKHITPTFTEPAQYEFPFRNTVSGEVVVIQAPSWYRATCRLINGRHRSATKGHWRAMTYVPAIKPHDFRDYSLVVITPASVLKAAA